ncbi:hypothetical protein [Glycomyces harbinensis]|nr:hypothetical protein [Glycomyces harbinensis]
MQSGDPQNQEEGFANLLSLAGENIAALVEEFGAEDRDLGLRRWLLELIASAKTAGAIPILKEQLASSDEMLRYWARHGLEILDTKQSRTIL